MARHILKPAKNTAQLSSTSTVHGHRKAILSLIHNQYALTTPVPDYYRRVKPYLDETKKVASFCRAVLSYFYMDNTEVHQKDVWVNLKQIIDVGEEFDISVKEIKNQLNTMSEPEGDSAQVLVKRESRSKEIQKVRFTTKELCHLCRNGLSDEDGAKMADGNTPKYFPTIVVNLKDATFAETDNDVGVDDDDKDAEAQYTLPPIELCDQSTLEDGNLSFLCEMGTHRTCWPRRNKRNFVDNSGTPRISKFCQLHAKNIETQVKLHQRYDDAGVPLPPKKKSKKSSSKSSSKRKKFDYTDDSDIPPLKTSRGSDPNENSPSENASIPNGSSAMPRKPADTAQIDTNDTRPSQEFDEFDRHDSDSSDSMPVPEPIMVSDDSDDEDFGEVLPDPIMVSDDSDDEDFGEVPPDPIPADEALGQVSDNEPEPDLDVIDGIVDDEDGLPTLETLETIETEFKSRHQGTDSQAAGGAKTSSTETNGTDHLNGKAKEDTNEPKPHHKPSGDTVGDGQRGGDDDMKGRTHEVDNKYDDNGASDNGYADSTATLHDGGMRSPAHRRMFLEEVQMRVSQDFAAESAAVIDHVFEAVEKQDDDEPRDLDGFKRDSLQKLDEEINADPNNALKIVQRKNATLKHHIEILRCIHYYTEKRARNMNRQASEARLVFMEKSIDSNLR
ncbi:hypothetical protein SARC_00132 [Sphaeroforma arctica JP610]|uniref:Uncharacterized protein n=1 Tax=Sphaeroforma arctica JP610 TaxID=667725 RepID=A0A0L0GFC4_9EUKA|nr:hypothetical protein SARC_00132 [Sphaeroforma arctica JP610]KNC87760.1 hypothetical protein SARC_00132 [Sphaeroforma arctica JP610]|eukprot:XP_014161662.1 hypothetical protein SARC_00132 [Sphaeroforma arctica JP610]